MPEIDDLLVRVRTGDEQARNELFAELRLPLKNMIRMRLNRHLRQRMDDSDILQDVFVEANRRLDDYLSAPKVTFLLWMRTILRDKMLEVHRNHLATHKRNVHHEVSLDQVLLPATDSGVLAAHLVGHKTSPSQHALKAELKLQLQLALDELKPIDREILSMRHFEHLNNLEVANELGISPDSASKRYLRALDRVRDLMKRYGWI